MNAGEIMVKKSLLSKKRNKDTRKLGFTKDNWEKQTGRKRKDRSKISTTNNTRSGNTNNTCDTQKPFTPSIDHATHQTDPKYFIHKGLEVLRSCTTLSTTNDTIL